MKVPCRSLFLKLEYELASPTGFLVKAMVFPVVMNGCESWTVKKAEHHVKKLMLLNCGVGEDS